MIRIRGALPGIDPFMVAMLGAILLAALWPQLGARDGLLPMGAITQGGIGFVFFLHGARLSRSALRSGAANWRLHLLIQSCTFILFPAIGLAAFFLLEGVFPPEARLGFMFLCAVSSTVSTSISMVSIAGGNVGAAVFNATLSSLLGLVATPMLMGLVSLTGDTRLPLLDAIMDISLILLLPFALGHLAPVALRSLVQKHRAAIAQVDRVVIVLIVFASFADSFAEGLWRRYDPATLLLLGAMTGALLALVLFLTTLAARAAGFSRSDEIAAVFCGSKKSLANGAPIALVLFGATPTLGMILLPLMIYHQLQLVVGAWLARRYAEGWREHSAG